MKKRLCKISQDEQELLLRGYIAIFQVKRLCLLQWYSRLSDDDFLKNFNEFRTEKNRESINFMYDNYDVFRLLLVCSKGTPYESFQERLVEIEMQGIIDLFGVLEKRGLPHKTVTDNELHILCTTFVTALCETIKHEYTREQALKHLDFIGKMLYPGMKEVLGF